MGGHNRKSHEEFVDEVWSIHNNSLLVLGEYKGARESIEVKCLKCNESWEPIASGLIGKRKSGCPNCKLVRMTEKRRKTEELSFIKKVEGSKDYKLISTYINTNEKVTILHELCGRPFKMSPRHFIRGNRCSNCAKDAKRKTNSAFIKEVRSLLDSEYQLLGVYKNCKTKLLVKHNLCNHTYEVSPSNLLRGRRCPKCKCSRGEKCISEFLNKSLIEFMLEKTYDKCVSKKKLRFDFFIGNMILVEFDGRQHFYFNSNSGFGDKNGFLKTQERDKIKNQYCIENKLPLIRIPYWEFKNIEYILENVLIHFNLIENKNDTYDKDIVLKYLVDEDWDHDKYIEMSKNIKK